MIVSAYDEADRLPATLAALGDAFPGARVLVADDGSRDRTPHVVLQAGAELVRSPRTIGKGGATTLAAQRVLARALEPEPPVIVLCDGDLGESARELPALARRGGRGGPGPGDRALPGQGGRRLRLRRPVLALGDTTAHRPRAVPRRSRASARCAAPVLAVVVPFGARFGMETAMNIDAARAGFRVGEIELDLAHRATGKTLRGFLHRLRQLKDFALVYLDRR